MPSVALILLPGALLTGFFMLAVPAVVLMTVWTVITMCRILFPERPLPFDAAARREAARRQGRAVPVRLQDILDDQRRPVRRPVLPQAQTIHPEETAPRTDPLYQDLWLRRN
ncbi:MAG: hypothetical protein ACK41D_00825 [Rubricoccaceae bacterium]